MSTKSMGSTKIESELLAWRISMAWLHERCVVRRGLRFTAGCAWRDWGVGLRFTAYPWLLHAGVHLGPLYASVTRVQRHKP